MDAEELYRISRKHEYPNSSGGDPQGLSTRVYNALYRAQGLVDKDTNIINIKELKTRVLDGTIWRVRGVGDASVFEICQWIIKQECEQHETPRPLPSDEGELAEKANPKNGDGGGGVRRK